MPDRRTPFQNAGERELLVDFLDYLRESVVIKTSGLSDEDVRKPMVPSGTSLLWLVNHLADVEGYWFDTVFAGGDGGVPPGDTAESAISAYRAAWARSNEVVAACHDLDTLSARPHRDQHTSLRWILVHMVEETARHAGHADIIREQLDGAVGR